MDRPQVVLDTNVIVSALRSRKGASFRLLELLAAGRFGIALSVPVVLEYEQEAKALSANSILSVQDAEDAVEYLCTVARLCKVFYLWRPFLRHGKDDMVLELAVSAECEAIVTHNKKDFAGADQFGLRVISPKEFLHELGDMT